MTGALLQMSGAVVDLVYRVPGLPARGAESLATGMDMVPGGGFNAVMAARRAGLAVRYGGGHGTGLLADTLRRALAAADIPVLLPRHPAVDQGSCVVLVEPSGERTFVSHAGAEGRLDPAALAAVRPAPGEWVLLSGYTLAYPGSRDALAGWVAGLAAETRFVFDPSPAVAEIPAAIVETVLGRARWVTLNTAEAAVLTGAGALPPSGDLPTGLAMRLVERLGPAAGGVVLRGGAAGCRVAVRGGAVTHVPGFAVDSIDTTGAGDAHIGAFIAALDRGDEAVAAARYANAAAALSTTRAGPATAPTAAETRGFLADRADAAPPARPSTPTLEEETRR